MTTPVQHPHRDNRVYTVMPDSSGFDGYTLTTAETAALSDRIREAGAAVDLPALRDLVVERDAANGSLLFSAGTGAHPTLLYVDGVEWRVVGGPTRELVDGGKLDAGWDNDAVRSFLDAARSTTKPKGRLRRFADRF